jgi:hypothetical protein
MLFLTLGYFLTILQQRMEDAETYEDWLEAASRVDELEGSNNWKAIDQSPFYDSELVRSRLQEMQRVRLRKRYVLFVTMREQHDRLLNFQLPLPTCPPLLRLMKFFLQACAEQDMPAIISSLRSGLVRNRKAPKIVPPGPLVVGSACLNFLESLHGPRVFTDYAKTTVAVGGIGDPRLHNETVRSAATCNVDMP